MVLTVWLFLALLSVGEGTSEWEKGRVGDVSSVSQILYVAIAQQRW